MNPKSKSSLINPSSSLPFSTPVAEDLGSETIIAFRSLYIDYFLYDHLF